MKLSYDYSIKDLQNTDVRFIGLNTADGFRWCKDGIPGERELKRTYIIKGAAGTGKSTLMKNAADRFESSGIPVVRFLCSSDPDSLDAVLIGKKILILDGTSPHLKDVSYPGALSELICLGNFWNKEKLIGRSAGIVELSKEKGRCFRKAYRFMSGMKQLSSEMYEDALGTLDLTKTRKAVKRIAVGLNTSDDTPSSSETIVKAFGMKGAVRLPTFEKRSNKVVSVSDLYGTGRVFLHLLSEELRTSGVPFTFSPDPLFDGQISDIFVPGDGILFSADKTDHADKILNMERFVNKERLGDVRGEIRLAYKCWDALRHDAETELRRAAEHHFELERIYGSAMNFDAVSAYQKLLIKEIENRL